MLELKNISKAYNKEVILNNISFGIDRAKTLGLVGLSGSGKTTIAHIILNLTAPDSGSVEFKNEAIDSFNYKKMRNYRKEVQIVFQNPYDALNAKMIVGESIAEGIIELLGKNKEEAWHIARAKMESVGLNKNRFFDYPHQFSGGERQRICLARVMSVNPRLIVLDEPVSSLDLTIQAEIINLLHDIQETEGTSFLYISHDIATVEKMSDDIAVLHDGKIVEYDKAECVLNNPRHMWTQTLLKLTR